MKKKPAYINWDKCIHIHACRRFATIVERKTGKKISRGCGKDCEAYEEHDEKTIEKACKWLEEHGDAYAKADYVPELDYTPDAWMSGYLVDDFKEAMLDDE